MDASAFSVDTISEFVESKTELPVAPIIVSRKTLLHDSRVWMAGAVLVYLFSVSGSMHNVIRTVPMLLTDREGRSVFFYQGSEMQLGGEGFILGFLYAIVGLMLAFLTHGVVRWRSVGAQRRMMYVAMVLVYWAVGKVISLDSWKTGYHVHAFWPASWKGKREN